VLGSDVVTRAVLLRHAEEAERQAASWEAAGAHGLWVLRRRDAAALRSLAARPGAQLLSQSAKH
jgi:hypothetical protein